MRNLHSCQRLTLLVLATVGLYVVERQLAARSDHILIKLYFLPFFAGVGWLCLVPLSLLGLVVFGLAAYSSQLGVDIVGTHASEALAVEAAAIGFGLWVNRLKCRLQDTTKQLETIQQHAPVGLAVVDRDGRLQQLNPALAQLLEVNGSELIGRPWRDLCKPDPQAAGGDCHRLRVPGGWRPVEVISRPWPPTTGTAPDGRLIQVIDCQERMDVLATLQAERSRLQQNLQVSLRASSLVHEIKQPLAALMLRCHQLQLTQPTPESPSIDALLSCAEALNSTVEAMAILIRSVRPANLQPVNLGALVRTCLAEREPQRLQQAVALLQVGLEQPVFVQAEPELLRILVNNLLVNALESLEDCAQPRRLEVTLGGQGRWIDLMVADSGPGLATEELSALHLKSSKETGLGLGLFTAETIAQQHGGRLEAGRSSSLGGAQLRLRLPRLDRHGPEGSGATPPTAPARPR